MAFSDIDRQKIKNKVGGLCSKMTPQYLRDKLWFDYEIENQNVIIYEIRPAFRKPGEYTKMTIAKFSYVKSGGLWKLYWKRASGKWHRYETASSAKSLDALVRKIERDSYGCFFG